MSKKRRRGAETQGRARDRPAGEPHPSASRAAASLSREKACRGGGVTAMTQAQTAARGVRLAPATGYARSAAEMASSEVIYSAVKRIADALATMNVHLYRGGDRLTEDPRDHMLSLRPNRRQSAFQFKQAMEICRNTEGRAYAVKRFNAHGYLTEMECLSPERVTPLEEQETGDVWYRILREDGVSEYIHNWYVMSLFHASTNGMHGVRVTDVLRGALTYSRDVNQFSLEALKNVNNAVVLEYPLSMGHEHRVRSVKETLDIYRETGGKVIALDAGVSAKMLGGSAIDAKMFDVERVTRSRAALVYTMPPHLLGDYSDAKESSPEHQNIEFLTLTMNPIVTQWQEELNYKLLTRAEREGGMEFRFDMEAYLRADSAAMANIRQSQIRCGWRTVNEIRKKDYLPPVEGGDTALVSKDLAPLDLVAKGATVDADVLNGEKNAAK